MNDRPDCVQQYSRVHRITANPSSEVQNVGGVDAHQHTGRPRVAYADGLRLVDDDDGGGDYVIICLFPGLLPVLI